MGRLSNSDHGSTTSVAKDLEQADIVEVYQPNQYANIGLSTEDASFYDNFPDDKRKKMIRKIDFRLVPVLALLYLAGM